MAAMLSWEDKLNALIKLDSHWTNAASKSSICASEKNIVKLTVYSNIPWPNHKQWRVNHISNIKKITKWSTNTNDNLMAYERFLHHAPLWGESTHKGLAVLGFDVFFVVSRNKRLTIVGDCRWYYWVQSVSYFIMIFITITGVFIPRAIPSEPRI